MNTLFSKHFITKGLHNYIYGLFDVNYGINVCACMCVCVHVCVRVCEKNSKQLCNSSHSSN